LSKGRSLLIAGSSGAGKSTLINMLSGITLPTEGNIKVLGYNPNCEEIRSNLSWVWNEISLFPNMSIIDNLRFFLFLRKKKKEANIKIQKILDDFKLTYDQKMFVSNLSTGTQRKVDICRALLNDFEILFLDEPSSFLDNRSKKSLVKILTNYKKNGKSIIIISHHASLFSDLIDDVIILKNGKIIYNQPVENLTNNTKEFRNAFILKTSNRILSNDILQMLPGVESTYISQKAVHVYLKEGFTIDSLINSLNNNNIRIKKIISKEKNLDTLIGEIMNAS
jgi:ABC-type multidrug transport system ATPase subunit